MSKKSFVMYKDIKVQIDALSDGEAGKLIKAIYEYQVNNNESELEPLTGMVFLFVKQQFERDHIKYEERVEVSRINGSKGGRPKKWHNLKEPNESQKTQQVIINPEEPNETGQNLNEPKKGDTVNDTVSVTVNDNDNVSDKDINKENEKIAKEILEENKKDSIKDSFDDIYSYYPSSGKKGKSPAFKKYKEYRRLKTVPGNQILIDHIEASKKTKQWQDGYIPHFSTWMNQRRWEDEISQEEIVLTEEEQRAEIRREIEERRNRV
jgi:hypothetical protein